MSTDTVQGMNADSDHYGMNIKTIPVYTVLYVLTSMLPLQFPYNELLQ